MVTVTRQGSITTAAGDHVFSLHANELVLVNVDGRCLLVAEQAVRDHPGIILHAITCLRHGLEFDVMRYARLDTPF